jgi:anti-sigma factor RsiW
MNHDEVKQLLGPYQDGELDLATCLKLEEHLAACPSCQQALAVEQDLVSLVQSETPRFKASPFLKTRIQAALREQMFSETAMPWWKQISPVWAYSGFAAVAAMVVIFAIGFFSLRQVPELAQNAVADHVRSLQVNHLMDVASTDQHTVKPWFAGKLDYSPQVVDLAPSGYPLVGGRLDVLDDRNVAALIYQRRKHYINLFMWPANAHSVHGVYNQNGYHVLCWTKSGMNYVAVSELGENELKDFTAMIQDQTIESRPGE